MKYFICQCIFESKLGCGFVDIHRLIEDGFIDHRFMLFLKNDCYWICCKDTINFLFECNRERDIRNTCGTIKFPINCIDLLEFGYEYLCSRCESLLFFYFRDILVEF